MHIHLMTQLKLDQQKWQKIFGTRFKDNEWGDIIDHVLTQTLNEQKWQQFTLEIFQRQYTTLQTMHNEEDLTLVTCVLPKQIVFQKYFKTRDNLCQTMHMSTEQDLGGICKHMYPRSKFGPRPSS